MKPDGYSLLELPNCHNLGMQLAVVSILKTPEAAVTREVKEELGIDLDPNKLKFVITVPYDFGEGSIHYFSAPLSIDTELHVDQNEIVEHKWFVLAEAMKLPMYNALRTFLGEL